VESSALRCLLEKICANKTSLLARFKHYDSGETGARDATYLARIALSHLLHVVLLPAPSHVLAAPGICRGSLITP